MSTPASAASHGAAAARRPAFRRCCESGDQRSTGAGPRRPRGARVECFFALLAEADDTSLLRGGGGGGLRFAKAAGAAFLAAGGAADLLAVTLWLDALAASA